MAVAIEQGLAAPRVTVIIPCYNREKYLRQAIDSVLGQTWPNVELVVVDDGSTDGSAEVLKSYGDRIRVLTHPGRANRGQSASINLGLASSESEYVAILDSDDWWAEDKLRLQVEYLEANPDFGLVYGNGYQVTESGERKWRIYDRGHTDESDPARVLADCYFLVPNNSLVRRRVFDEVGGFDESLRAAQDHDMAIRIAEATKIAYIPEDLFFYRRHDDSISKKGTKTRWTNGFHILEKAAQRYPYTPRALRRRRAVLHFRMGQVLANERAWMARRRISSARS
jgi:glycosyltransferase involved in cell wall biosynthesis